MSPRLLPLLYLTHCPLQSLLPHSRLPVRLPLTVEGIEGIVRTVIRQERKATSVRSAATGVWSEATSVYIATYVIYNKIRFSKPPSELGVDPGSC